MLEIDVEAVVGGADFRDDGGRCCRREAQDALGLDLASETRDLEVLGAERGPPLGNTMRLTA
mgnify:CR=1 FL=1